MDLTVQLVDRLEGPKDQVGVIIQSIEDGTENLGRIESMKSKDITLKLFALRVGTLPVHGLHIRDSIANKEFSFKRTLGQIIVRQS
jgi:hypothetical protein